MSKKIETLNESKLCYGTFLFLLCEHRHTGASNQGISQDTIHNALTRLDEVFTFSQPLTVHNVADNKNQTASAYKRCTGPKSLPIQRREFPLEISEQCRLDPSVFVNHIEKIISILDLSSDDNQTKLIGKILELIRDDTIDAEVVVDCINNITKSSLVNCEKNFVLSSFLAGIFLYIVINVKDNHLGRDTIKKWQKSAPAGDSFAKKISLVSNVSSGGGTSQRLLNPACEAYFNSRIGFDKHLLKIMSANKSLPSIYSGIEYEGTPCEDIKDVLDMVTMPNGSSFLFLFGEGGSGKAWLLLSTWAKLIKQNNAVYISLRQMKFVKKKAL